MIGFSNNRFEMNLRFVNELVPVKMFNCCDVFFANFDELFLQVAFNLADSPRLKSREVGGNDAGTQSRYGIRKKGSLVYDLIILNFLRHHYELR